MVLRLPLGGSNFLSDPAPEEIAFQARNLKGGAEAARSWRQAYEETDRLRILASNIELAVFP